VPKITGKALNQATARKNLCWAGNRKARSLVIKNVGTKLDHSLDGFSVLANAVALPQSRRAKKAAGCRKSEQRLLQHARQLAAYARRLATTSWEAEDLVQETYARAFANQHQLRESNRDRAWLFRIARNLHLDRLKSARQRLESTGINDSDGVDLQRCCAKQAARQLRPDLERALSALQDEQRECLLLCEIWGFGYAEIADILGCPIGTVRSRIARARQALLLQLAGEGQ
jgi:RNA polymerase sigma-70 factor (ECF subfamily)